MQDPQAAVHEGASNEAGFLAGGGFMGDLIRAKDWSATPLGPVETWSPTLRMMVSFLLANRFPLLLWWGPQYVSIYNDAYRPVLGNKHPNALGQPVSECWSEIWHVLQPLIDSPFHGGPATWMEDLALEINRHGFVEETHFTVAYSPVPDETVPGGIGGVLATVHEITEKVIGERRIRVLSDLGIRAIEGKTAEAACAIAAETIANHPRDIPFALLYLLDPDGKQARLAGAAGVATDTQLSPVAVDLTGRSASQDPWRLADVLRGESTVVVDDLEQRFMDISVTDIPAGPWSDRPRAAVVVPIRSTTAHQLAGVLVAGVSARLPLDHLYLSFFDLVGSQIATAIANALSHEEEQRRAAALAELDRAKTVFFSNVSHEFRTPLTLMLGPLEGLLGDPSSLAPEQRQQLSVAHRNGLRLLRLVNTLLDFSRIEAGRAQASYQPTDLAALTADLASQFRSATERAGLSLAIECPPLPEPVFVDRDMWEKVVLNLLSNAFKFTLEGGITVALRAAGGQADGGQVELQVRDTGVGISPHELPRLFERFHRVEGSRARTHEGTGIGLALVQELARLHGGAVRVDSTPGSGSTFTVNIPFGTAHLPPERVQMQNDIVSTAIGSQPFVEEALRWLPPETALPATAVREGDFDRPAASGSRHAAGTILLADDNADMRDYVARLLAPHYDIRVAADGAQALDEIRKRRPDLVLSDVMMPQLDGLGLVREVRADPALADLPIILLSARAGEEASVHGLQAGADDYLFKPFGARELLARVAGTLKMARVRREFEGRIAADLRGMTRLHEVGVRCARADYKLSDCLNDVLDTAIEIMNADKGTLQLLDSASDTLRIAVHRNFGQPFLDHFAEVSRPEGTAGGTALRSACQVLVEDVSESAIFAGYPSRDVLRDQGVVALQVTPLLSSSQAVLGLISTHFTKPHHFDASEMRLIDLLARQTADYLQRKQAEEALRKAQAQLQAVFDNSPLGVYLVDGAFRIRNVNPTAQSMFGDIPDLAGQDFAAVIHRLWPPSYADEIVRHFRHTLETGEPYHVPEQAERRLDREVTEYYEWQINRVPLPEGWYGVVCYFRDISAQAHARQAIAEAGEKLRRLNEQLEMRVEAEVSAREQAQAQLAHSQRMEALGQLAGGIAHDFNNVLQAVSGGLTLIEKRTQDAYLRRLASMAGEAAARGSAITGRLLSFARQGELRATSVEPLPLLENLREMLTPTLGTAIAIHIGVAANTPPLLADKAQLETVLVNLAINARDAMPDGGTLSMSVASERVEHTPPGAGAPGPYLRIQVADTGKGMDAGTLAHASEPFFTTKLSGQGTGLGLAMARGFAQQSGGDFLIESTLGRGTTVTLWFPEADQATVDTRSDPGPMHGTASAHVLVADDDPMVREVLAWQLIAQGYRVTQTSDGLAALAELESGNIPDLLVTDFAMPGMNGLVLIQEARRHRKGLPALLLTGYADGNIGNDVLSMDLNLTTLLRKPVSNSDLLEHAAALLIAGRDRMASDAGVSEAATFHG